ncbi:hypothetical protein ACFQ41_00470 [Lacticaseibacillus suilingensis]|mgnify:CR=1 FL=1|uniref:Uncharacterized protein n=1 Tax=Lacticaseibacillus suilingensis TaxID=2799577 RepID=A0ABW4BE45_9LACO|nr:hypothetical protein [Lacticaseibacillus suilingensis]
MKTMEDFYTEMARRSDYAGEGDACGLYTFGLVSVLTAESNEYLRVKIASPYTVSNFIISIQHGDFAPVLDKIEAEQIHTF